MATTFKRASVDTIITTGQNITSTVPNVNGIWSWFGDPRAIHRNGSTYIGTLNSSGDVLIVKYVHATGVQTSFTLKSALQTDDHDNPSLHFLPNGRLITFYCAHNGASMYSRISTNAEDISAWGAETTVTGVGECSYPHPVQLSAESNRLYLFYRYQSPYGKRYYVTSDDNGATWATPVKYLDLLNERPYVKITSNNIDKIHFAWNDAHPNEITANNLYHAYYTNGNFYKSDGTLIESIAQLPMVPSNATKIYDSEATGIKSWVWDLTLDSNGYPVIAYATFPTTTDHRYRYARWNGSSWIDNEVVDGGPYLYSGEAYYSGGICLDLNNPSIVYVSKLFNKREIVKLTTSNNGVDWIAERITQDSTQDNCRPGSIVNHTDDFPVLWWQGRYTSYVSYNTKTYSTRIA